MEGDEVWGQAERGGEVFQTGLTKAESWTKERKERVMLSLVVCLLPGRRANGQRWW